ncbi:hypothetical protein N7467_006925 [Penicillium canescens]|nr:hypothetical protein N7467_006925 [Penicillium canescens]
MEYIEGKVIDPLEDINAIEKVAGVVDYFATFRHDIPGPLFGGTCRGLLFPETKDLVFDSLDEIEKWFNSWLFAYNPKLNFQGCELVLCYLDIAPRNILYQEDGSLCLINWASARYYPRLFEFCAQWIIEGKDGEFNSLLLKSMNPLLYQEIAQKESVLCAWKNIQKYPFRTKNTNSSKTLSRDSMDRIPAPPYPMPDYPPGWYEQAQREGVTPTGTGEQNRVYNRVARYLRAIWAPHPKPSDAA